MSRPNPTGHPARYSEPIVEMLADIILAEYPEPFNRPVVLDPCAGTGEALETLRDLLTHRDDPYHFGFNVKGVEIEEPFIKRPDIVVHGDSTEAPLMRRIANENGNGRAVICTSVVYPNGVADNFIPKDGSKRFTYIATLLKLTGNPEYRLHPNNQANYGYRGTKRGGISKRRARYWELADAMLTVWAEIADVVVLNVSDFKHTTGEIEPVVVDWRQRLAAHGFTDQLEFPVATPRMKNGSNADQRVEVEVIIRARKQRVV